MKKLDCKDLIDGCSSADEFAVRLIAGVSSEEWCQLEQGGFEGEINDFNRATLLRLRERGVDDAPSGPFDAADVERMADLLQSFLGQHMPDDPDAGRWIMFSCLALAFVFREPLHPIERVQAEARVADGKATYYCPAREGDETLCGYCVCRPMSELLEIEDRVVTRTLQAHGEKSADIHALLLRSGMVEANVISTSALAFCEEVRQICAGNACGSYDSCWACPPAVGTLEECRRRCLSFDAMLLFSRAYLLEDSFDFAGMANALSDFKKRVVNVAPALRERAGQALVLSNEGCGICSECTWPDAPCRFPDKCLHSIEGYGLTVSALASSAGMRYFNGPNTVTFFGAVLYNA